MRRALLLFSGTVLLLLAACDDYKIPVTPCDQGLEDVSFSGDIEPFFKDKCNACHGGNTSPNLSKGWAYDELTEGGHVDVDFPCESSLYLVVSGNHGSHISVNVTDEQQAMIRGWIQEGAQNN